MNILPLVLVLLLILSITTIEKLEKFKRLTVVQKEYQFYLAEQDRQALNRRQRKLYDSDATSQRQLSFRLFFDKKLRESKAEELTQMRLILIELMRILYGEAAFFKEMERKRPNFLDELLDGFIAAADRLNEEGAAQLSKKEDKIRQIEDIMRVKLDDAELQDTFYRMLKGTITKDKWKELKPLTPRNQEKSYFSLLNFIHNKNEQVIFIRRASRELLKAIFGKEEIVEAIIARRSELDPEKVADATGQFTSEFKGKQRPGISDSLLNFEIKSGDKSAYD